MATFISYNRQDQVIAQEIALFLVSENENVWYDEWELTAGDSIVEEIERGLKSCSCFLILWSKHSAKSDWVRRELRSTLARALQDRTPRVIPVVLDQSPLPELLADIKYLGYHGGDENDRCEIVKAVTGREPSHGFVRAVVKKYHELVKCSEDILRSPGLIGPTYSFCPRCGSGRYEKVEGARIDSDAHSYEITCKECGFHVSEYW